MSPESEGIITVSVDGSRSDLRIWETVRATPREKLPPLTPAQKQVAASLRIPEELYSRSVEAGRRGADALIKKAERFARLLHERLRAKDPRVRIERVDLNVWDQRFEVLLRINGRVEALQVAEDLVDGLFESGSREAEERFSRVLDYGLSLTGPE